MKIKCLTSFILLAALASPAHAGNVLLGIAEGVAEQSNYGEMQDKYQPLADYLGRVLKDKVVLESSQNIKSAMLNLKKKRYELLFCRPSNVAAIGIRDDGYQLVGMAKGSFTADFIVRKDSAIKKKEDVLGHSFAMPGANSLMARVGMATLRDLGEKPDPKKIRYTHYQEAVNFMVANKFSDVGIVAPQQSKAWEKTGGVTLFKSRKLPFWSIIASPKINKADVTRLQKALIEMENSDEGKKILAKISVKGWVAGDPKEYVDMLSWLGT
jgi:ABC-type phosphate/phosphonate transport system substrate-binding protein